jgi:hypothetical protein
MEFLEAWVNTQRYLAVAAHNVCAGLVLACAAFPAPPSCSSNWQMFPNFS